MPKLVLNAGTPQAQEFFLKPGKNYIGRGFANDFKLDDASVSGSHAVFAMNGPIVTVTDLGSTNGTRINQLPATGNPLQSGQVVRLGGIELRFVADATPSAAAPGIPVPPPAPTAAAQIATEFFIRDPSHVGVAPAVTPPPPPAPAAAAPVPVLKIPSAIPSSPPPAPIAPVPTLVAAAPAPVAPAPVPQIIPSAPPPPPTPVIPIIIPPAPSPALKIPTAAPSPPPTPVIPVPAPPPAPMAPARIVAPAAPPPASTFAAGAAAGPPR